MREFDLIEQISTRMARPAGVRLGIGDDAAQLKAGAFDLMALDTMVEGVHYNPSWSTGEDVGWKLLACNLSDIAAMGGEPGPYLLALSVGPGVGEGFLAGLVEGLAQAAETLAPGCSALGPIGGDTTRSPGVSVFSLTQLGRSPDVGAVVRSGARPGDRIAVIGGLGGAAAGLAALGEGFHDDGASGALFRAHRRPVAQVEAGALLGRAGVATAMIDVSDGFAQDLGHILRQSSVGAKIEASTLPLTPGARAMAERLGVDAVDWALGGGDDYVLVATIAPERAAEAESLVPGLCWVGQCTAAEAGLSIVDGEGRKLSVGGLGFEHVFGREEQS